MPDQTEQIILEIDDTPAVAATERANAGLEKYEDTAVKATTGVAKSFEAASERIIRVSDRSRTSVERLVAAAEKKASASGQSGIEKIVAERDALINKLGGETQAVDRVRTAYDRLIATQKAADNTALLEKAIAASQRATTATQQFETATRRANKANEDGIAVLEKRASLAGKSSGAKVDFEEKLALRDFGKTESDINRIKGSFQQIRQAAADAEAGGVNSINSLGSAFSFLSTKVLLPLLAFDTLKTVFKDLILGSALYAARTEQLAIALEAVGKANNVASSSLFAQVENLKKIGIVGQDAQASLARLVASQIDYAKATDLARAAQNLGRVAGISSTEAFEKLTHAIITQQPDLLRFLGLNVNLQREFTAIAKLTKRHAEDLTESEKRQITLNAVLKAAAAYNGVYERSLETAGGQLLSLQRYALEAKEAFGKEFLPELTLVVNALYAGAKHADGLAAGLANVIKIMAQLPVKFDRAQTIADTLTLSDSDLNKGLAATAARLNAAKNESAIGRVKTQADLQAEALRVIAEKKQVEQHKEILAAEKATAAFRRQAELGELSGLEKIYEKRKQLLETEGKSPKSIQNIEAGIRAELATENKKLKEAFDKDSNKGLIERSKIQTIQLKEIFAASAEEFKIGVKLRDELGAIQRKTAEEGFAFELEKSDATRDAELRSAELSNGKSLQQKIALEQKKAEIEAASILRTFKLRADLLELEQKADLVKSQAESDKAGESAAQSAQRRDAIIQLSAEKGAVLELKTQASIDATRENALIRSRQLIIDNNIKVFEGLKGSVGTLFDAVVTRSKSFGQALSDAIKIPFLAAIKEIVSTRVAGLLFQLFGGGKVGFSGSNAEFGGAIGATGGGGNILGKLLGIGGAGALGLGGFGGGGSGGIPGAPGGTSGFAGPVTSLPGLAGVGSNSAGTIFGGTQAIGQVSRIGGAGTAGGFGTLGTLSGVSGLALGGSALGLLGAYKAGQSGNTALRAASPAIGAAAGLVGFGALASIFPALIGVGPIGWIAAAGIGAAFGIIGLLKTSAEKKIVDRVKAVYGITISQSFAKDPLAGIIKQNFGGNIDVGLQSPQVKDLIELYSMSTGQNSFGINRRATPLSFGISSSGSISASPTFINGTAIGLDRLTSSPVASNAGQITVQLDRDATTAILQGQAVETIAANPRVVQAASLASIRQNSNRRTVAAGYLQPGLLTS